jgi:hypothetical protein
MKSDIVFFLGFLFFVVSTFFVLANPSDTELDISNGPPLFLGIIPNFTVDGSLLNAFDLDDYFEDFQGDNLSYNFTSVPNINVVINENNEVSFFVIGGFVGVESVSFFASDGEYSAQSNLVYFGVGVDIVPPTWHNPTKDKQKVYSGELVSFNALWKDNYGLDRYYTEIDFGEGWIKYHGTFSGIESTSDNDINITAPVGKIVPWRICGFDFSDNYNCTDIYEFTVKKVPSVPGGGESSGDYDYDTGSGGGSAGGITGENIKDLYEGVGELFVDKIEKFSVSVDSILVELSQGTSKTQVVEIINTGTEDLYFDLKLSKIKNYLFLSEENFTIDSGESKIITLDFVINLTVEPMQYFGELLISGPEDVLIPIVVDVNPSNLVFEVVVDTFPEIVKPGKEIHANLSILNNGDLVLSDVNLYYAVKDFYGNIYDSNEEVLSFDKRLDLVRSLNVPEDVLLGKYIFYARVSNEKDIAIDSDIFMVGLSFILEAFLKSSISFIAILILSILAVLLVFRHNKQKSKEKVLNLYVKLNELKELVKESKYDQAANLYISIKKIYGEPVPGDVLENRERLVSLMKDLAGKVNFEESSLEEGGDSDNGDERKEGVEVGEEKKDISIEESNEKNVDVDLKKDQLDDSNDDKVEDKKEENLDNGEREGGNIEEEVANNSENGDNKEGVGGKDDKLFVKKKVVKKKKTVKKPSKKVVKKKKTVKKLSKKVNLKEKKENKKSKARYKK